MPTPAGAAHRSASASTRPTCAARMVRAPARRRRLEPARAGRVRGRAAPSLRRRRPGDAGLRGHQPADRPRPDDLEALGGRAHARAAVRRRQRAPARPAISAPCSRSAPAAATRRRCSPRRRRRVVSVERLKPLHEKARDPARADALEPSCAWCSATARSVTRPARPTTASSPPPAPARSRRRGSSSSRSAAVSSRRCSRRARGQVLVVVDRTADGYTRTHEAVKFVPLKSGLAR